MRLPISTDHRFLSSSNMSRWPGAHSRQVTACVRVADMAFRDRIPDLVAAFDELPDLAATAVIPSSGGVSVLTGPLGSGKSFAVDRLFRAAVERAGDPDARLPVYINARHVTADLRAYCTRAVSQLGDPSVLGAAIIVDQLDDLPATDAQSLYLRKRTYGPTDCGDPGVSWPAWQGVLLVARSVSQWLPFPDASAVTIREMTPGRSRAVGGHGVGPSRSSPLDLA